MANRVLLGNVKGDTGSIGATGPAGANGENGITPRIENGIWWIGQENTGITAEGNQWLYGDTDPSAQGNNGDLFINILSFDIFKKINNIWSKLGNIKGPKGEQGIQGVKGETALTFQIGEVTTVENDQPARVENVGTGTDIVLDIAIPKGENGQSFDDAPDNGKIYGRKDRAWQEINDLKGTTVKIGGDDVDEIEFTEDPQRQINNKQVFNLITDEKPVDYNDDTYPLNQICFDKKNKKIYGFLYNNHSRNLWYDLTPTSHIIYTDINVTQDMYSNDNTYDEYPYTVTINLEQVTFLSFANVVFNIYDATSGNFAPIVETFNGYINIYAKEIVETNIPTIDIISNYMGGV